MLFLRFLIQKVCVFVFREEKKKTLKYTHELKQCENCNFQLIQIIFKLVKLKKTTYDEAVEDGVEKFRNFLKHNFSAEKKITQFYKKKKIFIVQLIDYSQDHTIVQYVVPTIIHNIV